MALLPSAATAADAPPDMLGAPVSLTLDLTGKVPSRCGFVTAPATSANLGDLTVAGNIALPFKLDCNAPYAIKVRSDHGALARVGQAPAGSPFPITLDYVVGLTVATDLAPVSGQCAVSTLSSQACSWSAGLSSGDGVSIGTNGSLTVSWTAPAQTRLAGQYQDQITLTVEVRA